MYAALALDCLLAASDFDLTCFKLGYTPFSTLSDLTPIFL